MVVGSLQEILPEYPSISDFWSAEVLLRQAQMAKAQGSDLAAVVSRYRAALDRGRRALNGSVVLQAGHSLGFELATNLGSFREIASAQFAVLEGVELQACDYDRLETLGTNLLTFWGKIDYRRLSEHELEVIRLLRDPAREMVAAETPLEAARATMVLLLVRLFKHSGPGREWAASRVVDRRAILPEDTARLADV
jgi:hypothetical protein